jgi:hypothetical protein
MDTVAGAGNNQMSTTWQVSPGTGAATASPSASSGQAASTTRKQQRGDHPAGKDKEMGAP